MSKIKVKAKAVYKASDGSEHASAAAADRRNTLVTLSDEASKAIEAALRAMGDAALTADGTPLGACKSSTCWWIATGFADLPQLFEEYFWPHYLEFCIDDRRQRVVVNFDKWNNSGQRNRKEIDVRELYFDREKAQRVHVEAVEKRIETYRVILKEQKQRYGIS